MSKVVSRSYKLLIGLFPRAWYLGKKVNPVRDIDWSLSWRRQGSLFSEVSLLVSSGHRRRGFFFHPHYYLTCLIDQATESLICQGCDAHYK
jgi:hypothetical protein